LAGFSVSPLEYESNDCKVLIQKNQAKFELEFYFDFIKPHAPVYLRVKGGV
jgi:hypothetical protein